MAPSLIPVNCPTCGDYYFPELPADAAAHARTHANVIAWMGAMRYGWAPLLAEAEARYVLGTRLPRPQPDIETALRALDDARSDAAGPVLLAGERLFGRADVMAALAQPYEVTVDPRRAGFAPPAVQAFPRWARLLHTALFGAERFRALGWVAAVEETRRCGAAGPPYEPWRLPHAQWGCWPRHLLEFFARGRLSDTHERATPNCRRVVQGKVDDLGRKARGRP